MAEHTATRQSPRLTTLVFVTQVLDPNDPVLGFVPSYLRPLSRRVDHLVVIANEVRSVPHDLNAEVVSLGKEKGHGRQRRLARYEATLGRLALRRGSAAIVAHMCPIYLVLASPVAKLAGMRSLLWFAGPWDTFRLRTAERMTDAIVTTSQSSYPRRSSKVHAIGQAIDLDIFAYCPRSDHREPFTLLALGRTAPAKNFPMIIQATAYARERGASVVLRIVGASTTPAEVQHRRELEKVIAELGVSDVVTLESGVPHEAVPDLIKRSSALVNATVEGSGDKTVFEAAASGRPVLATSHTFDSLLRGLPLELHFQADDVHILTDKIVTLATAPRISLGTGGTGAEKPCGGPSLKRPLG